MGDQALRPPSSPVRGSAVLAPQPTGDSGDAPAGGRADTRRGPAGGSGGPRARQAGTGGRFPSRPALLAALLAFLMVVTGALAYVAVGHGQPPSSSARGQATPGVPASLADLMQLSPVPRTAAPDFTLIDQRGQTSSLSSFRGRAVVLEFMDDHCTDICPIVSTEFVDAFKALGPAASRAVFVAVNVNPFHTSVGEVGAFSEQQGLGTIPSWHFFTGSVPDLERVWHDYGISVEASDPNADIVHTSLVYFVDPRGRERFAAAPTNQHTASGAAYLPLSQQAAWGRGIALVTTSLMRS